MITVIYPQPLSWDMLHGNKIKDLPKLQVEMAFCTKPVGPP